MSTPAPEVRPAPPCRSHPERAALAVCVGCRRPLCGECATRMQGIHRCSDCVAALGRVEAGTAPASRAVTIAAALAAYGLLAVLLYAARGALAL